MLTSPVELEGIVAGVEGNRDGPHGGHGLGQGLLVGRNVDFTCGIGSRVFWIVPAGSVLWRGKKTR
jgi:hypothetical protein